MRDLCAYCILPSVLSSLTGMDFSDSKGKNEKVYIVYKTSCYHDPPKLLHVKVQPELITK